MEYLYYLVVFAILIVLIILMVGLGGFTKGGDFNRKYANKIMRYRIIGQAVAILLILIYVGVRQSGGN
jgi:Mn2+/Fe2+ NRAMP family transporter